MLKLINQSKALQIEGGDISLIGTLIKFLISDSENNKVQLNIKTSGTTQLINQIRINKLKAGTIAT